MLREMRVLWEVNWTPEGLLNYNNRGRDRVIAVMALSLFSAFFAGFMDMVVCSLLVVNKEFGIFRKYFACVFFFFQNGKDCAGA